jgi:predicted transcriptional regulator
MVTNTLINLKSKLTVDSINALLLRNLNLTQIADIHGVTPSAVSHYISDHSEEIIYDRENRDLLLVAKTDRLVNKGIDHINNILSSHTGFDKKDLPSLSITTGTIFDKMRILQNKSTQNVSMDVNSSNMNETMKEIQASEARLRELTGETKEIVDV